MKLHWCFGHGLKIYMWFRCNPQIIFLLLFPQVNLVIFRALSITVNGQGISCERNSSYSFILILLKLHWCFGHGLKIYLGFRCNPQIIFCYFFHKLNLVVFRALSITVNGQGISCGRNSSYSFILILLNLV